MDTDNTQDGAEPSPASAGSQPVGVLFRDGRLIFDALWTDHDEACAYAAQVYAHFSQPSDVIPLYRKPTLTDEEREAIEGMISDYQDIAEFNEERCHPHYAEKARRRAAMLIGLLERLG